MNLPAGSGEVISQPDIEGESLGYFPIILDVGSQIVSSRPGVAGNYSCRVNPSQFQGGQTGTSSGSYVIECVITRRSACPVVMICAANPLASKFDVMLAL